METKIYEYDIFDLMRCILDKLNGVKTMQSMEATIIRAS